VRVYEKLRQGIWLYSGVFHLVHSWQKDDGRRKVLKFKLVAVKEEEDFSRTLNLAGWCLAARCLHYPLYRCPKIPSGR
jgi:hypothetical protein